MTDRTITRAELIKELQALRKRVAELEQESRASRQRADPLQTARPEDQLGEVQHMANLATWVWDIQRNSAKVSKEHVRIFGTEPDDFNNNALEQFLKLVHPDDRVHWNEDFEECIRTRSPGNIGYRIIRLDGAERFLIDRFDVVCNETGTIHNLQEVGEVFGNDFRALQ